MNGIECRDAGDYQSCEDEEQATSVTGEKVAMSQIPMKDSGETFDKLGQSPCPSSPVNKGAGSAQTCYDGNSVLDPPIFDMSLSCHQHCESLMCDEQNDSHAVVDAQISVSHMCREKTETGSDEAADLFARRNEKLSAGTFCDSRENLKMECESSAGTSPDKGVESLDWQQCHPHSFFHEEDGLILQSNRSWEGNEENDQNRQDLLESMAEAIDCSSHPYLGGLTLDELDDDSIFHIASFMEARSLRHGFGPVCKRFQAMFDNEAYWKTRINMKWQKKYPAVMTPADFCWEEACVVGEDCQRVWGDPGAHTHHFMYACNVYGEVDTVHLMQNGKLLLSGDRNRNLNVINLSKYTPTDSAPTPEEMNDMLALSNSTIHKGWIWSLTSVDNHVMTGSWDTRIRVFDLNSDLDNFSVHKCRSAVLSLYAEQNDIVASCFDKKIYFFDRRSDKCTSRVYHKQAVMSVTGNQDYVISGSEDKTVAIYDRKAGKVFKTIKLDAYSLCLSFEDNQLWFGDKSGLVHLYDANRGMFNHVGTYDVGHKDKVTDIIYTRGSMFTCSGDKTLKVLTPTRDPEEIMSFDVHNKELAKIAYSNGVLASAGGDESIGVWLPKHWDHNTYLV